VAWNVGKRGQLTLYCSGPLGLTPFLDRRELLGRKAKSVAQTAIVEKEVNACRANSEVAYSTTG